MLHPSIGTVIFGRYTLRRELARGGMGSVWEAQDRKLRRPVAVKLLYPVWTKSQDAMARFEREAMAVARLKSPHVVQIFDYGVESECPFIVMEMLDGEDLRARLKRTRRLSLEETSSIVVQTAKALAAAHAVGIVHRDLKPGNVFLQRGRDEELVRVLDFGVAKATMADDMDQETTKEGAILGTPRYMSPEQALQSRAVDFRTDLWSLGVIAFRALTGKVPFSGKSAADIIVRLCTERPPTATSFAPDLPAEVDAFFERALQRRPESRFRSAREMAAAFARISPTSFPSLDMPTPTPAIASARARVARPRSDPRQARAARKAAAQVGADPPQGARPLPHLLAPEDDDETPTIGIPGMALEANSARPVETGAVVALATAAPPLVRPALVTPAPDPNGSAVRVEPGQAASGVVAQFAGAGREGTDLDVDGETLQEALQPRSDRASGTARWLAGLGAVVLILIIIAIGATRLRARGVSVSSGADVAQPGDEPPLSDGPVAGEQTAASAEAAGGGASALGGSPEPSAEERPEPSDEPPEAIVRAEPDTGGVQERTPPPRPAAPPPPRPAPRPPAPRPTTSPTTTPRVPAKPTPPTPPEPEPDPFSERL